MLSFFKLRFYSSAFIIDSLEAVLDASQKGYIYRKVLEGSCHIKVLRVL